VAQEDGGLDRLCLVYQRLGDREKEEVIRLAEGFLNSQLAAHGVCVCPVEKAESVEFGGEVPCGV